MQTETTLERLQTLLPDVFNLKPQTGDLYLRFDLASSLQVAIPLIRVIETLQLPAQRITPIPNMPTYILGLMENRNKVFWAIDLAQRLKFTQSRRRVRQHNIVIVNLSTDSSASDQGPDSLLIGLSIQQIQTTLRLHPEELNFDVGTIKSELQPYFQGWFEHQEKKIFLLDIDAIVTMDELDNA